MVANVRSLLHIVRNHFIQWPSGWKCVRSFSSLQVSFSRKLVRNSIFHKKRSDWCKYIVDLTKADVAMCYECTIQVSNDIMILIFLTFRFQSLEILRKVSWMITNLQVAQKSLTHFGKIKTRICTWGSILLVQCTWHYKVILDSRRLWLESFWKAVNPHVRLFMKRKEGECLCCYGFPYGDIWNRCLI